MMQDKGPSEFSIQPPRREQSHDIYPKIEKGKTRNPGKYADLGLYNIQGIELKQMKIST